MAVNEQSRIADTTKLTDLTVGDLRALIHEIVEDVVQRAVFELEQQLPDPDADLELKPEFAEQLQQSLNEQSEFYTLEQVKKELGLDA